MSGKHSTNGVVRYAGYYRKSTDHQEQSIDRQKAQVVPYVTRQGGKLVAEYTDEGVPGDEFEKRSDFQRLLRDAAAAKFDVIVVDEPSRLSRQNPIELIEKVVAPLRRSGVRIDTVTKGPLDYESLAGIIMMTVHAHKSEEEPRDPSRRTLGGIAKKAKAGNWFGWAPPYGLRIVREIDQETGKVVSRACVFGPEEEVRAVRFIFDAVANRGWPLRRVCRELEARRVKPPVPRGAGRTGRPGAGTSAPSARCSATASTSVTCPGTRSTRASTPPGRMTRPSSPPRSTAAPPATTRATWLSSSTPSRPSSTVTPSPVPTPP